MSGSDIIPQSSLKVGTHEILHNQDYYYYVYPVYSQYRLAGALFKIQEIYCHYYVYPVYSQSTSWSVVILLLHYIKEVNLVLRND